MMSIRLIISLAVLGGVSAHASLGETIYMKVLGLVKRAEAYIFDSPLLEENKAPEEHHGHHGHHGPWHHHHKFHKMMKESHKCHRNCGTDADCHSKCPKPWAVLSKACKTFPAIKACHETCKDADCENCPKFEVDWMNEKLAKHPEKVAKIAEAKCPMVEKIYQCHHACKPGDHECHHKCPKMFPHHHHHHHHGEEGHHGPWHEIKEAHHCHHMCGDDVACHSKCPKPMEKFVKACHDLPAIKACRDKCTQEDCDKCPKFDEEWMNKKFAEFPEKFAKKAEGKCPLIEKAHTCHKACAAGDFECHHKCPHPFGHHHGHHDGHHHHGHHHHGHHHGHHDGDHHHGHHDGRHLEEKQEVHV